MTVKTKLADAYLEYKNDYLSTEKFAQSLGVSKEQALTIISLGRVFHEERALGYQKLEKQMVAYSNHNGIGIRHRSGVFDVPLGAAPYTQFVPFMTLETAKAFIDSGRAVDGHTVYDINTQTTAAAKTKENRPAIDWSVSATSL